MPLRPAQDSNGIAELAVSSDGSHILLGQKVSEDADRNVYWHLYMDVDDSISLDRPHPRQPPKASSSTA